MNLNYVLKKPVITEKALAQSALGKYIFEVDKQARKNEIKKAVKAAFGVDVVSIRTVNIPGKTRRFGRRRTRIKLSDRKKAIIQLAPGQKIDIYSVPGEAEERRPSSAKATGGKKEEKKK